jgi:hypothetical protein
MNKRTNLLYPTFLVLGMITGMLLMKLKNSQGIKAEYTLEVLSNNLVRLKPVDGPQVYTITFKQIEETIDKDNL